MFTKILAVMLALAPYEPAARLKSLAGEVSAAAATYEEALTLAVISFYETTLGRSGVPYGLSCCRDHSAGRALEVWRDSARCGPWLATRLGYYHSGACRADAYSAREARTVARLTPRRAASRRTSLSCR